MSTTEQEQVRQLARLSGIEISDDELAEVTNRFQTLVGELDRLNELDLAGIDPIAVFPDEEEGS